MKIQVLVFVVCLFVAATCDHLILGNTNNNQNMIHHTTAHYTAIPFIKRVKNVFYSGHSVINSIMAYDNKHTNATAAVTAGGIGYTYVNLRLKSERGKELDYDIGIYA
ncbi:uncharacterized protein LOC124634512 [Helicoverpa zea]|uniref:Uncharacterized protein n=1 Tax=Helicoverpa armigera TaxID=29058 RepID=A0A2W1BY77_HELAM|nr:uncharacterized protein LOC110375644 [Helicoverpa armigera]XP_047026068.1 uncharacterized protein LOC124634512 [Helicoverpa zea]PZC78605.1 hypothetical protein B5X24_HaOG201982 [Helicoverpa armigera]